MGLTHLLDTNICVVVIRQRGAAVLSRLQRMTPGSVGVSIITVSELECGAAKSLHPQRNREALEQFLLPLEILDYDSAAALHYGEIRSHLEKAGTPTWAAVTKKLADDLHAHLIVGINMEADSPGIARGEIPLSVIL